MRAGKGFTLKVRGDGLGLALVNLNPGGRGGGRGRSGCYKTKQQQDQAADQGNGGNVVTGRNTIKQTGKHSNKPPQNWRPQEAKLITIKTIRQPTSIPAAKAKKWL